MFGFAGDSNCQVFEYFFPIPYSTKPGDFADVFQFYIKLIV